jgi:acetyltransferase-like isoleucine patch superfamily enzyme
MTLSTFSQSFFVKLIIVFLPWKAKCVFLHRLFGYNIDKSAHIGLAWIYPRHLIMLAGSSISSFTVAVNLDLVCLGHYSRIGRSNWITGFPTGTNSSHFSHQTDRRAELHLGDHSAISKCHHIDCTNVVLIGSYSTIAGYRTQILTHSIDIDSNRQHSEPIEIGSFSFVGTNCVLLGGSVLPSFSILGALSLLNKVHSDEYTLYAGQPARSIKSLDKNSGYFSRHIGFVL